jgi:hypothetical protein
MGAPQIPTPTPPPSSARPDRARAQMRALAFAETERRLRQSSGRRSTFLTGPAGTRATSSNNPNFLGQRPLLGM